MGVQVRIARAGVAVRERRRDQALHVDLGDPVPPPARVGGGLFQPRQGVSYRIVMSLLDHVGDLWGATAHNVETLLTGENDRS